MQILSKTRKFIAQLLLIFCIAGGGFSLTSFTVQAQEGGSTRLPPEICETTYYDYGAFILAIERCTIHGNTYEEWYIIV
jgi:hypothetical protein